jgi:CRISPR-associated protein Cas2
VSRFAPYIVAYDIGDDHERSNVDKVLRGFGMRVQKSVFECRLTRRQAEKLTTHIATLQVQTGFVLVYRLSDVGEPRVFGNRPHVFACDDDAAFVR